MKRGRPLKFGRPAQLLAVRLPEDAVQALQAIHADPAWAIVTLLDGAHRPAREPSPDPPVVELVKVGQQSLILVDQALVKAIPGVDIIPLARGRAFLALQSGQGMSDLELAVIDRMLDRSMSPTERAALKTLAGQLREWRRSRRLTFSSRSIIVVDRARSVPRARGSAARTASADRHGSKPWRRGAVRR